MPSPNRKNVASRSPPAATSTPVAIAPKPAIPISVCLTPNLFNKGTAAIATPTNVPAHAPLLHVASSTPTSNTSTLVHGVRQVRALTIKAIPMGMERSRTSARLFGDPNVPRRRGGVSSVTTAPAGMRTRATSATRPAPPTKAVSSRRMSRRSRKTDISTKNKASGSRMTVLRSRNANFGKSASTAAATAAKTKYPPRTNHRPRTDPNCPETIDRTIQAPTTAMTRISLTGLSIIPVRPITPTKGIDATATKLASRTLAIAINPIPSTRTRRIAVHIEVIPPDGSIA